MDKPFFTVYTPTYNRAHTLHRVHDSLKVQTCRDFEWLIVDDGSEDGTTALVEGWRAEGAVPLRYVRLAHGGAHLAHNACLREARGEVVLKLDSDDGCVAEALERLKLHWTGIPEAERGRYSGVTVLCRDQNGARVGSAFPQSPLDCSAAALEYRYGVRGEKWGFVRADILRCHPFPEGIRGHFVPESYVWVQVSRRFVTRHVNEELRVYWMDAPSLVHGVADPAVNADGHRLMFQMVLNEEAAWVLRAPWRLLRAAAQFARFSWLSGRGLRQQAGDLRGWLPHLVWAVALPLATLLHVRDRLRLVCSTVLARRTLPLAGS